MTFDTVRRLNDALEGRYRVERELGEGGMATVYLARDLRHERMVALKVLKPELAAAVGTERFLTEIRTTANLRHPHILPLYDSGDADGFLFYVMPHVEGESLRERIERDRQLPVEQAVAFATQVAAALDRAHRQAVVHRDIKPANILVEGGQAVVADFGIALAVSGSGGGRLTETGMSLGTPHYMSPEQATGDQHVGPAADIFSLGCVLYEMLAGEPPYTGSTAQAILGRIITTEPQPLIAQRQAVPANVDAAVRKALEKVPADRFANAGDFAAALTDPAFRHGPQASTPAPVGPWKLLAIGFGLATAGLAAVIGVAVLGPPPPAPVERFTLAHDQSEATPVLLPDDSGLVLSATNADGQRQLFLRHWGDLSLVPIIGTEGAQAFGSVAVSPDGSEVAFTLESRLVVAGLVTAGVRTLADDIYCCPRWAGDGFIYFSGIDRGIDRVPARGGSVEAVTTREPGDAVHSDFSPLPGGDAGVFAVWGDDQAGPQLETIRLATGERQALVAGRRPYLTSEGHLVYVTPAREIVAVPFDPETITLGSPILTVAEAVPFIPAPYSLSASGSLVYEVVPRGSSVMEPVWVSRSGQVTPVDSTWRFDPGAVSADLGLSLSPDDTRLATMMRSEEGDWDIWIKTMPDGPFTRLTFDRAHEIKPRWTGDGERVVFRSNRAGGGDLLWMRADGAGEPELFVDIEPDVEWATWTPDMTWIVLRVTGFSGSDGARDILAMRPGVDSVPEPVAATEFTEQAPALSPDGRWLAYSSNETGRDEIFVRSFPDFDRLKVQISRDGGIRPLWAHGGRELFYLNPATRELVAIEFETAPDFRAVATRALFTVPVGYHGTTGADFYAVASDDQRFLALRRVAPEATEATEPHLVLVRNWLSELKARLGN